MNGANSGTLDSAPINARPWWLLYINLDDTNLPILKYRQRAAAIHKLLNVLDERLATSLNSHSNVFTTIGLVKLILYRAAA